MDIQRVYPYNRMLFEDKKEWNTDTCSTWMNLGCQKLRADRE